MYTHTLVEKCIDLNLRKNISFLKKKTVSRPPLCAFDPSFRCQGDIRTFLSYMLQHGLLVPDLFC